MIVFCIGIAILAVLWYFDRHQRITMIIHSWGAFGTIVAILLMAAICMLPIPSEGLLIMYMKVYGIGWGILYAWLGSTVSTVVIFLISRYYGRLMLARVVQHERFEQVSRWVKARGSLGLLVARLLPVPAFIVNYTAGLIPTVRFWSYFWTGVVSILPYYAGAAMVYLGISRGWIWILIPGAVGIVVLCISLVARRSTCARPPDGHRHTGRFWDEN